MEAATKGNHRRAVGVATGDLDRVFHGLGTRGEQHAFVVLLATDHFIQARRDLDVRLVGHHLEAGVGDFADLAAYRFHHFRVVVADVEHADAANEIQVALAVHVPHFAALGVADHHRVGGGDAPWNVLLAQGQKALIFSQCRIHLDLHKRRAWRVVCDQDKDWPARHALNLPAALR
jgi:hypothetical protein